MSASGCALAFSVSLDFEGQAERFQSGLPGASIARALAELTGLRPDDVLLEVGCGPGLIGRHLRPLCRYVGFDSSPAMLERFPEAILADARERWPVDQARVVFGSRVLHLLDPSHIRQETRRVKATWLVEGKLRQGGLHREMRRAMRAALRQEGYAPRQSARKEGIVAATWSVREEGARILAGWRERPGLAGVDLPEEVKARVLESLRAFEGEVRESDHQYLLEAHS